MRKTVIEPNGKNLQYWHDLWNYRELAVNFAKRDITVRYKQTLIGLGWSIINPIINMVIMTFVFGNLAGFGDNSAVPYNIVVYAGIIPWTLFSRTFTLSSNVFMSNADLMKKVYFPRLIAPLGASLTSLIDTLISFAVLFVLMLFYRFLPPWQIILSLLFLLPIMLLAMFAGLFFASFSIKYRDFIQIVPVLVQLGQYASPVAYSLADIESRVSPFVYTLISLNPVSGFLEGFKWCVTGIGEFNVVSLLVSLAWLLVITPLAVHRFRKAERTFVDIV